MNTKRGKFLVFDGADCTGKTTLITEVIGNLKSKGYDVLYLREPGGCEVSEDVRLVLLNNRGYDMSFKAEALLYSASRAELVSTRILPALQEGKIVICDRYVYSSLVYQGYLKKLGLDVIYDLNFFATGGLEPDFVVWTYADLEIIKSRLKSRLLDRMDEFALKYTIDLLDAYEVVFEYCKCKNSNICIHKVDTSYLDVEILANNITKLIENELLNE